MLIKNENPNRSSSCPHLQFGWILIYHKTPLGQPLPAIPGDTALTILGNVMAMTYPRIPGTDLILSRSDNHGSLSVHPGKDTSKHHRVRGKQEALTQCRLNCVPQYPLTF